MRRRTCFLAATALTLGLSLAGSARADGPRTTTDWDRVLEGTMAWVASPFTPLAELDERARAKEASRAAAEKGTTVTVKPRAAARIEAVREAQLDSRTETRPAHWLELSPRISLVARDWGESHKIAGGSNLLLTDVMRVTRSSRVLMSRVHLGAGPLVPFVQVAVGQWRIDTNMLPALPGATEAASQVGFGFELAPMRGVRIACESSWTRFWREGRDREALPVTKVFGTLVAARAEF